jgi:hypothetical protein
MCKKEPVKPESSDGSASRWSAVIAVLALHLGVVALLLMERRSPPGFPSAAPAIEVMFLPPAKLPTARADGAHLQRLKVDTGISLAPPSLGSSWQSESAGGSNGGTPGVNWTAEARRAVKAFEIRRDQQVTHGTLGISLWDSWLARQPHHAGERLRTDSGDWIVWIDSDCYEVAHWHAGRPEETDPPVTTCVGDKAAPHAAAPDAATAGAKTGGAAAASATTGGATTSGATTGGAATGGATAGGATAGGATAGGATAGGATAGGAADQPRRPTQ